MKLEYICGECGQEISSSQYEELSDIFCPECGGHIEENTEKIWCFLNTNGQLIGPFYDSDLRDSYLNKEIHEQTEIFKIDSSEWKPLLKWDSLKSVTTVAMPAVKKTTTILDTENTNKTLLITCESCFHQFSKRAKKCPKCGWKPQEICQICHQKIPFDSAICPECGDPDPFQTQRTHKTVHRQVSDKGIGTKWLSFWSYFSLPFGGVLGILMSIGIPAIAIIIVPISIFQIITAIGLHYRKIWAWKANWVAIVLSWIGAAIPNINASNQNGSLGEFSGLFVILFLFSGVIWMWPNYIYWNKRKHLFTS